MGRYKVNNDGTLGAMISGRGKAEYGASHYEHGEKEEQTTVENYTDFNITFNTPFPDTNYEVIAEYSRDYEYFATPSITKSTTGMIVRAYLQPASFGTPRAIGLKWSAFKLYTDTEYNNILAAMPSDASASNKVITRSTIGVNSSASHKIAPGVSGAQVLAEAIWGMIKTDGSPESGVMPVMYEGHDYGIVMYGYLWEGTVKWCVYTLFLIASGTYHFRAKANVGTDEVIIYTS